MVTRHALGSALGVLSAAAALMPAAVVAPSAASAATGYHFSRTLTSQVGGQRVAFKGYGRHCGPSKYGTWSWKGTANLGAQGAINYVWTEIYINDGRARRLNYTSITGSYFNNLEGFARSIVVNAAKTELNKATVKVLSGGTRLQYNLLGRLVTVPFKPLPGC